MGVGLEFIRLEITASDRSQVGVRARARARVRVRVRVRALTARDERN